MAMERLKKFRKNEERGKVINYCGGLTFKWCIELVLSKLLSLCMRSLRRENPEEERSLSRRRRFFSQALPSITLRSL